MGRRLIGEEIGRGRFFADCSGNAVFLAGKVVVAMAIIRVSRKRTWLFWALC